MKTKTTRSMKKTTKSIKVRITEPSMVTILRVDTSSTAVSLDDGLIKGEVGFVKGFTFINYQGSHLAPFFRFRTKL